MVVHRLDMDTSGIIVYARSKKVLTILHDMFRAKSNQKLMTQSSLSLSSSSSSDKEEGNRSNIVTKTYEALVCGHMNVMEGEIDLPLLRDRKHPPFMKVWTGENNIFSPDDDDDNDNNERINAIDNENSKRSLHKHNGYIKMMSKAPKESLTEFRVISKEYLGVGNSACSEDIDSLLPVTRVELVPITGRTHQLRVHCAAIGHPIVGDNIYGMFGDGSPYGGFNHEDAMNLFPSMASTKVQENIYQLIKQAGIHTSRMENVNNLYEGKLYLHAKKLCLQHPVTNSPMHFEVDAPF